MQGMRSSEDVERARHNEKIMKEDNERRHKEILKKRDEMEKDIVNEEMCTVIDQYTRENGKIVKQSFIFDKE